MGDEYKKASQILKKINDLFGDIRKLFGDILDIFLNQKVFDREKLKRIKEMLEQAKRLKLEFLGCFKLKDLYTMMEDIDKAIDNALLVADNLCRIQDKFIKKMTKDFLKKLLKEIERKKHILKKALVKKLGQGPWIDSIEYMDKYIEKIFEHGYLDNDHSDEFIRNMIKSLHEFKMFIAAELTYRIAGLPFDWWYRRLSFFDFLLADLLKKYDQIKSDSDILKWLTEVDVTLSRLENFKKVMEKKLPHE